MTEHPSRDDNETTTGHRHCPICATPFIPIRRQTYDTNACRQIAWRRRRATTPPPIPPPTGGRRATTVYICPACDTRYLGEQWCHDSDDMCGTTRPV